MRSFTLGSFGALGALVALSANSISCSPASGENLNKGRHSDTSGSGSTGNGTGAGTGVDPGGNGGAGGDQGTLVGTNTNSVGGMGSNGCSKEVHQGERLPLDMYFLVDQSGSMQEGVTGGTKWTVVASALNSFFAAPANASSGAGIGYFPFSGGSSGGGGGGGSCKMGDPGCSCLGPFCFSLGAIISQTAGSCTVSDYATPDVGIAPLSTNAPLLTTSLQAHGPGGGTPTSPALQGAYQYVDAWAKANPARKTVLVLATDGDPSGCTGNDVQTISTTVIPPQTAGDPANGIPPIPTFVIGVGSSLTSLDALAAAGGTGKAFVIDTGADVATQFTAALDKIRGQAVPCDFSVPSDGTVDPGNVNVDYSGSSGNASLFKVTDQSACQPLTTGAADQRLQWYYNANQTQLSLCPLACKKLSDDGGQVQVVLGCPTVIDPIQ